LPSDIDSPRLAPERPSLHEGPGGLLAASVPAW